MKPLRRRASPHDVTARPAVEEYVQPIYDRQTIAAAATTTQLTFFEDAAGKNKVATNIKGSGTLPAPKIFTVTGVALALDGNTPVATDEVDQKLILWDSWFKLHIGSKEYLSVPTFMVPANYGIYGWKSTAAAEAGASWAAGPSMSLTRAALTISPQQEYHTEINFPVAPTLTTARDLWSIIYGILGREVQ